MCPTEIHVDVREQLGENRQFPLVGVADVEEVELDARVKKEQVVQEGRIGVCNEISISRMEAGMNLKRDFVAVCKLYDAVKHVVFQVTKRSIDKASKSLRQGFASTHHAIEIA